MQKYEHIFFDLDHTLWDFEKSSEETVIELVDKYKLHQVTKIAHIDFIQAFRKVNGILWYRYNIGKTTKKVIRDDRFKMIFDELQISHIHLPKHIGVEYLNLCPCKPNLIENTIEILEYLSKNYQLHILTNGFDDVQELKLVHSGIRNYFKCIITSESTGKTKPHKKIFKYALSVSDAKTSNSIMIGDNLNTDIAGAYAAGIDSIFFNPTASLVSHTALYEINDLLELKKIL